MEAYDKDFAHLLYTLLIVEEVQSVKEVAAELGLKEQALYARLYGRVRISVGEARRLIEILNDSRIPDFLFKESQFVAINRQPCDTAGGSENVRTQATSTMFDVTDVLREVEISLADDGRIDHQEKARIQQRMAEAERSLAALRHTLGEI